MFYVLPKGVKKRLDFFRVRLLWQEDQNVKKYHLVSWLLICQPKEQCGLGVVDLTIKNICFLGKWLWKLENENGIWQQMLRAKYMSKKTLGQCERKTGQSHFQNGLMQVKDLYNKFCVKTINSGKQTRFWHDAWLDGIALKDKYSSLLNIFLQQDITVFDAVSTNFQSMSFR